MFYHIRVIGLLLLSTLILSLSGCDDSSTGVDLDDAPQIPETLPVEIDNSIFTDNNPNGAEYQAFSEAGVFAMSANSSLVGATSMGSAFLGFTQNQEPDFIDGLWVWDFSYPGQGESFSIRTTAEEMPNGVEWNVYLNGSFDGEQELDNFRYLQGFVSNDGNTGNWQYTYPDSSGEFSTEYEWEITSETEFSFSSVINIPDEEGVLTSNYTRDGDENLLVFNGYETTQNVTVFWNSSTGIGYIDRPGESRRCWDDTFKQIECS